MAEFINAIVGLVAACAATGNSLHGVIDSWRSTPAEFQSLSNSVTDLRTILDRVNELLDNGMYTANRFRPKSEQFLKCD